jgi:hypothetical protein
MPSVAGLTQRQLAGDRTAVLEVAIIIFINHPLVETRQRGLVEGVRYENSVIDELQLPTDGYKGLRFVKGICMCALEAF